MTDVDVVLVKPGSQKRLYGELSAFELTAIEPPVWAALLAAVLRKAGFSATLLDAEVEGWDYQETAARAVGTNPLLVGVFVSGTNPSASTMNMTGAGEILRRVRELAPTQRTLLAGLHPSALPERTLREEDADFVCVGEGVYTLPKLLEALKTGSANWDIEGLWYRQGKRIVSNPRAPLVADLDSLPMAAWDLLPMERYRAHNWHCFDDIERRRPYAVIYTSLGCPFRCTFCCINAMFGKPGIRYRGAQSVAREVDHLVNQYGVRNIKILDEMFALNERHVAEICDLLADRGYDLNIWAYGRVNTVSRSMLRKMKKSGINWIAYGFESADPSALRNVSKGYNVDSVDSVVAMTRQEGLNICGNFMFGLPEDTYETMRATLDRAKDLNCEWVNFQSTMAYPGSRLYDMAIENGWSLPGAWEGFSQLGYHAFPLATRRVSGPEVLAFRDAAFAEYISNLRYLETLERKFGPTVKEHVRSMAKRKPARKYASSGPPIDG